MLIGLILSFIFGSIIGSFLNVLIIRLPEEHTIHGRSHCMNCKHDLSAIDLVPVFSYLFLRGKCRYCRSVISRRYFYIEVITGLLFALCFARIFPLSLYEYIIFAKYIFVSAVLMVIFMIDYEHFLILDKVVVFAASILFAFNLVLDLFAKTFWANSLTLNGLLAALGLFFFFGALHYFSKGKWMGFGDVKFAFVLGFATVFPVIVVNIFLSFLIGSLVGMVLIIARAKEMQSEIPFGTFLAVSCYITLLYGQEILVWYMNLIGLRFYV